MEAIREIPFYIGTNYTTYSFTFQFPLLDQIIIERITVFSIYLNQLKMFRWHSKKVFQFNNIQIQYENLSISKVNWNKT